MSDNELGIFLRARREAVTPADVGLPAGPRRRTPGLRRAELATLAGVSVEYLTRLEQGRDRNPSPQVLGALADALRLPYEERGHLRRLAKSAAGTSACPASAPPADSVRPTVQAVLDRLEPAPAVLLNRLGDVLARTGAYARVFGPLGVLDEPRPNVLRHLFTDPRARDAYLDWDRVADDRVATLKGGSTPGDPHFLHMTGELAVTAGAAFSGRLASVPAVPVPIGTERLAHPELGQLTLAYETLAMPDDQRILVHLPADDATAAALDRAARRPLRAVR
ncbi:helix-turn-helix transcriptional regulator [Spirillospora sp. NPDC029432]|uniref:helix-turn-helix domain-containing protein n=1 Tax=Spirillospora sp. NPDC029432 TaxID=3154599 RepID=UPI0034517D75